jgi:two-component system cell cycle sensor histidine kinase/response regulator CckA
MRLASAELPARSISSGWPTTVLLVEPECAVRILLARILAESGYVVISAGEGKEALELLSTEGTGVDVVVTEVILPSMSGAKLAAQIQRDYPGTAVLFMTGWFDDVVERYGIVESRVEMLRKPFGPRDLRRRVGEVLGRQVRRLVARAAA